MVFPAKLNFAWSKLTEPPGSVEIPPQSPGAGLDAVPSPLVSPPTESSMNEVNTTGLAVVPAATNDPSTTIVAQFQLLMTVPAFRVNVTPAAIVNVLQPPCSTGSNVPVHGRVAFTTWVSP